MDALQVFMSYADDFEKTFVDDDWSRLRQYFAQDATYEVLGEGVDCKLTGPDAIFAGIKKSLDGLDRRFDKRRIEPGDDLTSDAATLGISWRAIYEVDGQPPFVLEGRSDAVVRDGKIAHLKDSFDAAASRAMREWSRATGIELDPSYT